MAQRRTLQRRARALVRRFGLAGGRKAALACAMLLVVAAGLGAYLQADQYVTVERGDEATAEVPVAETVEQERPTEPAQTQTSASAADKDDKEDEAGATDAVVHVDGAVAVPGVYSVAGEPPRINDAVELAGGLLPDADTSTINLAQPLVDGQKVHVPYVGEEVRPDVQAAEALDGSADAGATDTGTADASRVNVNTATAEELQRLPGVGEATAASIVDDRERNGPFSSAEDLMRVSGIGEKKFDKMRGMIDV